MVEIINTLLFPTHPSLRSFGAGSLQDASDEILKRKLLTRDIFLQPFTKTVKNDAYFR
jgi:hypothetical protein